MVRMRDVAKLAGVSVATVSNVIAGKPTVNEEIRKDVLSAIEELNYHVNVMARGLKTQRSYSIGVVFPDVTKLFFLDVLKGIMDEAYKAGYRINILSSSDSFEAERELVKFLKSNQVEGIIVSSCVPWGKAKEWAAEIVSGADGTRLPAVSVESRIDGEIVSSVIVDNEYYSGQITRHLLESGRTRIFYISGPEHLWQEHARKEGYRKALEARGIAVDPELEAGGNYLSQTAYDAVEQALQKGVRFDAIQATNDQAAVGALKALKDKGIKVPEEVAICGFDNLFPGTLVSPAITTVHVPRYEMGVQATRELLRLIREKDASPIGYTLSGKVVVRASSCPEATSAWSLEKW